MIDAPGNSFSRFISLLW